MRQLRAIVLIGGALTAAAVVSFGYLRPTTHPAAPAVVQVERQTQTVHHFNLVGQADGGYYYVWVRDIGSSGGRAS
jgi:hypothetical protein